MTDRNQSAPMALDWDHVVIYANGIRHQFELPRCAELFVRRVDQETGAATIVHVAAPERPAANPEGGD